VIFVSVLITKPFAGEISADVAPLTILFNSKPVTPLEGMLYKPDPSPEIVPPVTFTLPSTFTLPFADKSLVYTCSNGCSGLPKVTVLPEGMFSVSI